MIDEQQLILKIKSRVNDYRARAQKEVGSAKYYENKISELLDMLDEIIDMSGDVKHE